MADNPIRSLFDNMDSTQLLSICAFFESDYSPESVIALREVAGRKGISDESIKQYRETCYPEIEMEFACRNCESELLLDLETFVAGEYTCPECSTFSRLDYVSLEMPMSVTGKIVANPALQVGLLGSFWRLRESEKKIAKREGILNGTYWPALQQIARDA